MYNLKGLLEPSCLARAYLLFAHENGDNKGQLRPAHTAPFLHKDTWKNLRFCDSVHTDSPNKAQKSRFSKRCQKWMSTKTEVM